MAVGIMQSILWNCISPILRFVSSGQMKRPIKGLTIYRGEARLSAQEREQVLKSLTRAHAHKLGRFQPSEIKGTCHRNHGYYVGAGVCLLQHFIEQTNGCVGCRSQEIVDQINWIFHNVPKFLGLSAEWGRNEKRLG